MREEYRKTLAIIAELIAHLQNAPHPPYLYQLENNDELKQWLIRYQDWYNTLRDLRQHPKGVKKP